MQMEMVFQQAVTKRNDKNRTKWRISKVIEKRIYSIWDVYYDNIRHLQRELKPLSYTVQTRL